MALIDTIYTESEIVEHPLSQSILARFPKAQRIEIERYGEVFNRHAQNFRLQKKHPAMILAKKYGKLMLPAPPGYGIGSEHNYYFSHMLNCIYDCRYCFLQGMYRSANYVLFVNFEDYQQAMDEALAQHDSDVYFFSGYDCDSLALDGVTGFADGFIDYIEQRDRAWLELRTKSAQVAPLLNREAVPRVVMAYSFTPKNISEALEIGVPPLKSRIEAMVKVQQHGWSIGLRFDPMVYHEGFEENYAQLFKNVFGALDVEKIHSVSLGPFRLPRAVFQRMAQLFPDEKLFASPIEDKGGMISYPRHIEAQMLDFCESEILSYIKPAQFFPCTYEGGAKQANQSACH